MKYVDLGGREPQVPPLQVAPLLHATATGTPLASVSLGSRASLGSLYVSQGHRAPGLVTNDCGPANAAMITNYVRMQAGGLPAATLADAVGTVNLRLPGWIPIVGGATHPSGVATGINRMASESGLDWEASAQTHGTQESLLQELRRGRPVAVLWVTSKDKAHWVTVTGYDFTSNVVSYLDPQPGLAGVDVADRLLAMPWDEFEGYWGNRVWWNSLLQIERSYITIQPMARPRPVPTPRELY